MTQKDNEKHVMTLDEAIKHCEEKSVGCDNCANEHRQLTKWLKELKIYKEAPEEMYNTKTE